MYLSFGHCLSVVGLQPSSSLPTGCVVSLRVGCVVFCHTGPGRVGRMWSAREKSLEILYHGWELNPDHGEDRQWDTFILPLSYQASATERTDSEMHSFSHWDITTRPRGGQTVNYPTELSWPGPPRRQTVRFIQFSHWAIMSDYWCIWRTIPLTNQSDWRWKSTILSLISLFLT